MSDVVIYILYLFSIYTQIYIFFECLGSYFTFGFYLGAILFYWFMVFFFAAEQSTLLISLRRSPSQKVHLYFPFPIFLQMDGRDRIGVPICFVLLRGTW